ncbi:MULTISPECIES: hypothetical protein [Paenibacillus]|uniref:Uncharacterized protein n=1 Tax=Paenibacillus validus TaxID=44253 RepID=A0A7X3CTE2_9BACL|nr:hypothetical protein [Paenibacillus validus]MUG71651.1 hypothetical protein [Paenibacillus validus]
MKVLVIIVDFISEKYSMNEQKSPAKSARTLKEPIFCCGIGMYPADEPEPAPEFPLTNNARHPS